MSPALVFTFVQSLTLPSLLALLFIALLAASEVGHRLGARHADAGRGGAARDREASTIATATFALLALLIAFTYAMALARYDARRAVVVDEANALRDAARLAPFLPDDDGAPIVNDLRRTLDLALGLGVPYDPSRFDADVAETASVSTRMWDRLGLAVAAQPGSLPATRVAQALTSLDDAVARRTAALRNHVPVTIYAILLGTALVAMAFAGYGAGAAGSSRRASAGVMALLLSFVVTVTIDLQRPDRGTVEIPLDPLTDVRAVLPPLP